MSSFALFDTLLEGCQVLGFDWTYLYLNASAEVHNRRSNVSLLGRVYQTEWPGIEDTEVFPFAARVLTTADLQSIGNEMAARRSLHAL